MKDCRIAIDVGHARGTGAAANGQQEHTVCTRIAHELQATLQRMGMQADVIDFPDRTNAQDLEATIRAVNAGRYRVSVSLHCDCADNEAAHGAHVCHRSLQGYTLAAEIADRLCPLLPGRAQRVVRRMDLAILRRTVPVAVLVECGFISHAHDAAVQVRLPHLIALKIAEGVQSYVKNILKLAD